MAAVVCKTINDLIGAACRAICLPCKALNLGCETLGDVMKSPFFPYLALTFALNLPPVVYSIRSALDWCPNLSDWLVPNGIIAAIHMIAAMYIVSKIRSSSSSSSNDDSTLVQATTGINNNNDNDKQSPPQKVEEGMYYRANLLSTSRNQHGAANSCQRLKHVLCYDQGVAVYIVVFIGWIFWLGVGIGRRVGGADGGDACDDHLRYISRSVTCGYFYMCLVGIAFAASLCCLR